MKKYLSRIVMVALIALPCIASDMSLRDQPAPSFDLTSLDGERVRLEDLRGKIVVLHFGTGW